MAFKMKGSPMKRNFNVGSSPVKHDSDNPHCHPTKNPDGSPTEEGKEEHKRKKKTTTKSENPLKQEEEEVLVSSVTGKPYPPYEMNKN